LKSPVVSAPLSLPPSARRALVVVDRLGIAGSAQLGRELGCSEFAAAQAFAALSKASCVEKAARGKWRVSKRGAGELSSGCQWVNPIGAYDRPLLNVRGFRKARRTPG
jgi:hypothetical protein